MSFSQLETSRLRTASSTTISIPSGMKMWAKWQEILNYRFNGSNWRQFRTKYTLTFDRKISIWTRPNWLANETETQRLLNWLKSSGLACGNSTQFRRKKNVWKTASVTTSAWLLFVEWRIRSDYRLSAHVFHSLRFIYTFLLLLHSLLALCDSSTSREVWTFALLPSSLMPRTFGWWNSMLAVLLFGDYMARCILQTSFLFLFIVRFAFDERKNKIKT